MKNIVYLIVGFLIAVALVWVAWFFIEVFLKSQPGVQAGIISFIAAVGVALYTHSATQKREINARHFAEKRAAYMQYIDLLFEFLHQEKTKKTLPEAQVFKKLLVFKKNLLVWGSADVIKAMSEFENVCDPSINTTDTGSALLSADKLFRALRKDLGHDDTQLGPTDLIGLILNSESKKELEDKLKNG